MKLKLPDQEKLARSYWSWLYFLKVVNMLSIFRDPQEEELIVKSLRTVAL